MPAIEAGTACSAASAELARDCAACGGNVECDGSCSMHTPPNLGEACGSCGGRIDCSGDCSVATPADYGTPLYRDSVDSFLCCFIDETRSYGLDGAGSSGCYPGFEYAGCTVSTLMGAGSVSIEDEDPASCTCRVRIQNSGLEGAAYAVHVRATRGCD